MPTSSTSARYRQLACALAIFLLTAARDEDPVRPLPVTPSPFCPLAGGSRWHFYHARTVRFLTPDRTTEVRPPLDLQDIFERELTGTEQIACIEYVNEREIAYAVGALMMSRGRSLGSTAPRTFHRGLILTEQLTTQDTMLRNSNGNSVHGFDLPAALLSAAEPGRSGMLQKRVSPGLLAHKAICVVLIMLTVSSCTKVVEVPKCDWGFIEDRDPSILGLGSIIIQTKDRRIIETDSFRVTEDGLLISAVLRRSQRVAVVPFTVHFLDIVSVSEPKTDYVKTLLYVAAIGFVVAFIIELANEGLPMDLLGH